MENILEYGTDWNLHKNLEAFKNGEQNIFKTSINIRKLFKHQDEQHRRDMDLSFFAEQERQRIALERDENDE